MNTDNVEWKVYFNGDFWGHHGRDHAGEEITLNRSFLWGGKYWLIPAVYLCSQGLVIDICLRAEAQDVQAFIDKWDLYHEHGRRFTQEEQENIRQEHPLGMDIRPRILLGGKTLREKHGSGLTWLPTSCLREGMNPGKDAAAVLEHYGLDPAYGWSISRICFPWATKRKPALHAFRLIMEQKTQEFAGPHFTASTPGETFSLTHPITGKAHLLTVLELQPETLDLSHFQTEYDDFPCHCLGMSYTVTPDLDSHQLSLRDTLENDPPKPKEGARSRGGAIGVFMSPRGRKRGDSPIHTAASALHYEPVEQVQWRTVFYAKTLEDVELEFTL